MKLVRRVETKLEVWTIERTAKKVTIVAGPDDGKKKTTTKVYGTPKKARDEHDAAIVKARALGFRVPGELDPPRVKVERDAALEGAIRFEPDNPDPYLVYADWLQARGCPLGDAIVLAHRGRAARALAIAQQIGLPQADIATVDFRLGFWRSLRIENELDWMDDSFDVAKVVAPIFASPLCAVLEELRVGILRWSHQDKDLPVLLALAGEQDWAADLRHLRLGDVSRDIDMDHHVIGTVGEAISEHFPNLRSLFLHSGASNGETFSFAGLELPKLGELVIETCALTKQRAKQLVAAELPLLAKLELWFGSPERSADATIAEISPIVDGKAFPGLRHLGLKNSTLSSAIIERLPRSALAKQLATLDLSMSTLDDAEAGRLAAAASAFPALASLVVDDTYVTAAGARALKRAFPKTKVSAKGPKSFYDWAPTERFVSVHE